MSRPATARYERGTDKVWIYTLSLDERDWAALCGQAVTV